MQLTTNKPIIIAIDGNSASGKGTISTKLAEHFGFAFLDTGLMYRILAKKVLEKNIDLTDQEGILKASLAIDFSNFNYTNCLHTNQISCAASKIACFPLVREKLNDYQRNFPAGKRGVVVDGRDIGTVIFPQADCKFFITADLKIRAKRRHAQLCKTDSNLKFDEVLQDMRQRDERDAKRAAAPMCMAKDAIVIDTTHLTAEEALNKVINLVNKKLSYYIDSTASTSGT
jgi:cytidylate kinase